ncbi:MAG: gamma-glutamyltransferase family protein [Phycisphaeraceae bacterium]
MTPTRTIQHCRILLRLILGVAILSSLAGCHTAPPMKAIGYGAAVHPRGAIACVHPLAAQAAIDAYEKGGNAVDAAVAAALTLGVVDGFNSGIGGGCFILIRTKDGEVYAIDGREMAPTAATRDMYIRDGKGDTSLSQTGALASGIPGSVAAYEKALVLAGKRELRDHLLPAAEIAQRGFHIDANYASRLRGAAGALAKFEGSRAVLLDTAGKPWPKGHVLMQPDLAKTYRAIAENGIVHFYGGPFAQSVERWMKNNGGIVTANDFSNYHVKLREPIVTTYRGHTIIGFPPPSSGGVHVAQILNILDCRPDMNSSLPFAVTSMARGLSLRTTRLHLIAEAMKLAFADRAYWLGDPDFAKVPRGLIAVEYARELAERIDAERASEVKKHGMPPGADRDFFELLRVGAKPSPMASPRAVGVSAFVRPTYPDDSADLAIGLGGIRENKHTTHISAADIEGNFVAITATVNTSFGSKVIIPGTGVVMNNQMDDFAIQPDVPNAFGLIGGDANAVAPGKRPLSSMSPTIVSKDGKPVLTLGAAGGPRIITAVLCTLVHRLDLKMSIEEAVAATRVHHQWRPDELRIEKGVEPAIIERLKTMGHKVQITGGMAILQAIGIDENGAWTAVSDNRLPDE